MAQTRKRSSKIRNENSPNPNQNELRATLIKQITDLNKEYETRGFSKQVLYVAALAVLNENHIKRRNVLYTIISNLICILIMLFNFAYMYWLSCSPSDRCILSNTNFLKHIVRPPDSCDYCKGITGAKIFGNMTKTQFSQHAYKQYPIVLENAFGHWPAMEEFDFDFFKDLYEYYPNAHGTNYFGDCSFMPYGSGISMLEELFEMNYSRVNNEEGERSWYVGWGNCDPDVLEEMRQYYPKPHFLPDDSEIPSKEYVFMGYDAGATMHLDFINRLMWQAQLKGTKTWYLKPSPECEDVCKSMMFSVGPGDAVLIDTRVWYHGTTITPGEFSLAIQSEYG